MSQTDNLNLPYILPGQSQKHVIHNEAIRRLDAMVHLSVVSRSLATPPMAPNPGDRYIVASDPTGDWLGEAGNLLAWQDGAWEAYVPAPGWLAWIIDEAQLAVWTGTEWTPINTTTSGPAVPPAPVLSLATGGAGSDNTALSWTIEPGDITGFESEYQEVGASAWTTGPTAASTDTTLTITGLAIGTSYQFRLRATGPGGTGNWSNTIQATTQAFTLYVDPATGNDTNPGTQAAPFATLTALLGELNALSAGETLSAHVAAATYTDQHLDTSNFAGEASITFAPGSRIEWTQAGTAASAIQANGASGVPAELTIYGNGLEIDGFLTGTGNGLGCNWATLIAHDVHVHNCIDGISGHGGGHIEAYRCRVTGCTKYPFAHVNNSTSHHEDCFFQPADDAIGAGATNNDLSHVFIRCTMLPPPNTGSNRLTLGAGTQLQQCELGGLGETVSLVGTINASDCFVEASMETNADAVMTRLFGKLTIRMREAGQIQITDSVFTGSPTNDSFIYSNHNPSSFGDVDVDRCVVTGFGSSAVQLKNATRLALWDASASEISDCVFHANGNDFDGFAAQAQRMTNISTADPGVGPANTLNMADYAVSASGVGFGQADSVTVGAPAAVRP
ncbi:MAG: DUF2793 domain-containing protein [Pseudomonadota bacterium]